MDRVVGESAIAAARPPLRRPGSLLPARGLRALGRLSGSRDLRRRGHRAALEARRPVCGPARKDRHVAAPIQGKRRIPAGAPELEGPTRLLRGRLLRQARALVQPEIDSRFQIPHSTCLRPGLAWNLESGIWNSPDYFTSPPRMIGRPDFGFPITTILEF